MSNVQETFQTLKNAELGKRRLIFLVGPSGSGKTVVARMLAPRLGYELIDVDRDIEASQRATIAEIFDRFGEPKFRNLEAKVITEILKSNRKAVVATGGGLPTIPGMMENLCSHGITVYLKAELGTLWARLDSDPQELSARPLLRENGIERLRELISARESLYLRSSVVFRTDSLSVESVCAAVAALILEGSK